MGETRLQRDARVREVEIRRAIGSSLRDLRTDAGLTIAAVANAAGIDPTFLSRIERGDRAASVGTLVTTGAVLGADLSVRLFPSSGPRIRDRFQAPMIEAFLRELHARWIRDPEVIVTKPSHGVIDLLLLDMRQRLAVASEFQSEVRRLEQQVRWHREKAAALPSSDVWPLLAAEDAPAVSRLLVLRSTRSTRELVDRFGSTLGAAYPARAADALASLTAAEAWPGPAIVWMRVEGGRARLIDGVPRGVRFGR
jgi:transcriptional regulator with XRE-family HTH domain